MCWCFFFNLFQLWKTSLSLLDLSTVHHCGFETEGTLYKFREKIRLWLKRSPTSSANLKTHSDSRVSRECFHSRSRLAHIDLHQEPHCLHVKQRTGLFKHQSTAWLLSVILPNQRWTERWNQQNIRLSSCDQNTEDIYRKPSYLAQCDATPPVMPGFCFCCSWWREHKHHSAAQLLWFSRKRNIWSFSGSACCRILAYNALNRSHRVVFFPALLVISQQIWINCLRQNAATRLLIKKKYSDLSFSANKSFCNYSHRSHGGENSFDISPFQNILLGLDFLMWKTLQRKQRKWWRWDLLKMSFRGK